MSFQVRKVSSSDARHYYSKAIALVVRGRRVLITKYRTPIAGIVPANDLRALQFLSEISPSTLSKLFKHGEDHNERVAIAALLTWRESIETED